MCGMSPCDAANSANSSSVRHDRMRRQTGAIWCRAPGLSPRFFLRGRESPVSSNAWSRVVRSRRTVRAMLLGTTMALLACAGCSGGDDHPSGASDEGPDGGAAPGTSQRRRRQRPDRDRETEPRNCKAGREGCPCDGGNEAVSPRPRLSPLRQLPRLLPQAFPGAKTANGPPASAASSHTEPRPRAQSRPDGALRYVSASPPSYAPYRSPTAPQRQGSTLPTGGHATSVTAPRHRAEHEPYDDRAEQGGLGEARLAHRSRVSRTPETCARRHRYQRASSMPRSVTMPVK